MNPPPRPSSAPRARPSPQGPHQLVPPPPQPTTAHGAALHSSAASATPPPYYHPAAHPPPALLPPPPPHHATAYAPPSHPAAADTAVQSHIYPALSHQHVYGPPPEARAAAPPPPPPPPLSLAAPNVSAPVPWPPHNFPYGFGGYAFSAPPPPSPHFRGGSPAVRVAAHGPLHLPNTTLPPPPRLQSAPYPPPASVHGGGARSAPPPPAYAAPPPAMPSSYAAPRTSPYPPPNLSVPPPALPGPRAIDNGSGSGSSSGRPAGMAYPPPQGGNYSQYPPPHPTHHHVNGDRERRDRSGGRDRSGSSSNDLADREHRRQSAAVHRDRRRRSPSRGRERDQRPRDDRGRRDRGGGGGRPSSTRPPRAEGRRPSDERRRDDDRRSRSSAANANAAASQRDRRRDHSPFRRRRRSPSPSRRHRSSPASSSSMPSTSSADPPPPSAAAAAAPIAAEWSSNEKAASLTQQTTTSIAETTDEQKDLLLKDEEDISQPQSPQDRPCSSAAAESADPIASRLLAHARMKPEEIIEQEKQIWTRSAPADLYYTRDHGNPLLMRATNRLIRLCDKFEEVVLKGAERVREKFPAYVPLKLKHTHSRCHNCSAGASDKSSSSSDSDCDEDSEEKQKNEAKNESLEWLQHRQAQANRLHNELWENRQGELNDGPACRCSIKSRKIGLRHGIYLGEPDPPLELDPLTNNISKLHHYHITISPPTNFLIKHPTVIHHDEHEFIFEGFSLFVSEPLKEIPPCKVVRFNIEYSILYFEEKMPDNFTLQELQLFHKYFFKELLQLADWNVEERFFFMPRFVRDLSENGKEILSMNEVMSYLLQSYTPLMGEMDLLSMLKMSQTEWLDVAENVKGMVVTKPGFQPPAIRVDQLDREQDGDETIQYPEIVHFGQRPPQMCYAGNAEYQKAWREFVKFRHLMANMAKPSYKDKRELEAKENRLTEMRSNSKMKRDVTVAVSSEGVYKTGLMTDIVQHGMLLPVLVHHLRLHASLEHLERRIGYTFANRSLLQLALTHPSYKENFGTTPDHARNTLTNCGIRQPEYGDKKIHHQSSRKRGINMLINIMSRFGKAKETESKVQHNERLEFLGDAVVEFITTVHLYHMFPDIEEGGLATYRAALVQNQHLAVLAQTLGLENYMLYAHGSDLCHDLELRHAMANCFEALMGAIFLDGDITIADRVFAEALFGAEPHLHETWTQLAPHPLQMQELKGDRHWIKTYPLLQKLSEFEAATGVEFTHIRLLARAFTDRSMGFNNLTLGSNQRMEFLGDTILQLVTSDFLYRHFPEHHEGHLSLLRSSMVNNRTQSVVCDDLGIPQFALYANPKLDLKMKDRADLLEAYLGALYVDKDLDYCRVFAEVCFFPRLQQFILNQEWNDPKSKLQQCALTLRTMDGGEPDIPIYKVIECKGPTNTRVYSVAVYFRNRRLAKATGHSIQQAEMNAAKDALLRYEDMFPHLAYQKKIVQRSFKRQSSDMIRKEWLEETLKMRKKLGMDDEHGEPVTATVKREQTPADKNESKAASSSPLPPESRRSSSSATDDACRKRSDRRLFDDPEGRRQRRNERVSEERRRRTEPRGRSPRSAERHTRDTSASRDDAAAAADSERRASREKDRFYGSENQDEHYRCDRRGDDERQSGGHRRHSKRMKGESGTDQSPLPPIDVKTEAGEPYSSSVTQLSSSTHHYPSSSAAAALAVAPGTSAAAAAAGTTTTDGFVKDEQLRLDMKWRKKKKSGSLFRRTLSARDDAREEGECSDDDSADGAGVAGGGGGGAGKDKRSGGGGGAVQLQPGIRGLVDYDSIDSPTDERAAPMQTESESRT